MLFKDLGVIEPILEALHETGYSSPTKIQEQAIPFILKGRDLLGCAQTGTGKTAAFTIPMLQLMNEQQAAGGNARQPITSLILAPTRELALQIGESIETYGKFLKLKHLVIFGGVSQYHQVKSLRAGVDILVATPGRLLDLIQQKHISLRHLKFLVLDEADRMLDAGFYNDIRKIISHLPEHKQTLLFSATLPAPIRQLSKMLLKDPEFVEVTPVPQQRNELSNRYISSKKETKPTCLSRYSRMKRSKRCWCSLR